MINNVRNKVERIMVILYVINFMSNSVKTIVGNNYMAIYCVLFNSIVEVGHVRVFSLQTRAEVISTATTSI